MSNDVRKGLTNAKFNEKNSSFLFSEILIISIISGLYWDSWLIFGSLLFSLIIFLTIKPLAIILCIFLSLSWAIIGFFIGSFFNSTSASIVMSLIGFFASLGIHLSALNWVKDIDIN